MVCATNSAFTTSFVDVLAASLKNIDMETLETVCVN